jgi:hypothetical protein
MLGRADQSSAFNVLLLRFDGYATCAAIAVPGSVTCRACWTAPRIAYARAQEVRATCLGFLELCSFTHTSRHPLRRLTRIRLRLGGRQSNYREH